MEARRTDIKLVFEGVDITEDINKYLLSLTYTDNDDDKSDDLQISIDDRENIWIGSWLNTLQGGKVKGAFVSAEIIQKNWEAEVQENRLDCGDFQVDSVDESGPPSKVTLKAASILQNTSIKTQKKTKAWEKYSLSKIAEEIASKNGMECMFESSFDPYYKRKEQLQTSDIAFLQKLCKDAGISLKVTAKKIVLFNKAEYEKKEAIRTIERGKADVLKYSLSTSSVDTTYSSCRVKYTDPETKKTFEATYKAPDADKDGQVLEINEKVESNAEAKTLAEKRLREKNSQEFKVSFGVAGDTMLVAGVTVLVKGWGAFDGKYIVETATHTVSSSGYRTDITLRRVLEGY